MLLFLSSEVKNVGDIELFFLFSSLLFSQSLLFPSLVSVQTVLSLLSSYLSGGQTDPLSCLRCTL